MKEGKTVTHTLSPLYDADSRVLILGTMPSPKSREYGCYYGHPQNRFWRVLAAVFEEEPPLAVAEREAFARRHHIALWDVLSSCTICGASDGSIRDPQPNDLSLILGAADIRMVFTTGSKAAALYKRLLLPMTGRESVALPSTSPANCRSYSLERLIECYRVVRESVEKEREIAQKTP